MKTIRTKTRRDGTAYIIALILLAFFTAMASAFAVFSNTSVQTSKNVADIHRAQLAAEGGMAISVRAIRRLSLPSDTDDDTIMLNITQALADRLNGSDNLGGAVVTGDGSTVTIPAIATEDGSFTTRVIKQAGGTISLEVEGVANGVRRTIAIDIVLIDEHPNSVFNYGLASRGSINISGSGEIRGMNAFTEASVISATEGDVAVSLSGSAVVQGDISVVGSSTVEIGSNVTVAGQTGDAINQHVHFGVEAPVFPEVDTTIFAPLATGDIVDSSTDTSQPGMVFNNVLIKAGANRTFASDVTINGIIFIESPNIVVFAGKVTLRGLVATEDGGDIEECKITFAGQVDAFGVEALPEAGFEDIKEMTGTFVVAPGFDVNFAGQFTTINGTVAADKLTFSGQSGGTVKGSVIGLADHPTDISGTVDIIIDRSDDDSADAGFSIPKALAVVPRTYLEVTP